MSNSKLKLSSLSLPKCQNVGVQGKLPPLLDKVTGFTDYPNKGDNLKICFENSQYALFPIDLAIHLAKAYPKAWCRGGNYFGNYAFEHWFNAMVAIAENTPIPTDSLRWMKKREQYIARHRKDFRLAGTIAMIKWAGYVDGDSGRGSGATDGSSLMYMVELIERYGH